MHNFRNRRILALFGQLTLPLGLLSFILFSPVSVKAQEKIIVGLVGTNFSQLPFQVALEKGFYRKHGIEIQHVLMSAPVAITALQFGNIDYSAQYAGIVRGAMRGLDMRLIFSTSDKQMFSLVVQPNIQTSEDIKGKILGSYSPGSLADVVLVQVLNAVGIQPNRDVKIIYFGGETALAAQLRSKQIAGSLISPPESIRLKKEGFKVLLDASDHVDLPLTGLGTTNKKLKENQEQVRRMLRALHESLRFISTNKKEAIDILARWLKLDSQTANETYESAAKTLTLDGMSSDKALIASIGVEKKTLNLSGSFSPEDVSDFSLLKAVIKEYDQKK